MCHDLLQCRKWVIGVGSLFVEIHNLYLGYSLCCYEWNYDGLIILIFIYLFAIVMIFFFFFWAWCWGFMVDLFWSSSFVDGSLWGKTSFDILLYYCEAYGELVFEIIYSLRYIRNNYIHFFLCSEFRGRNSFKGGRVVTP
jgi:hypothetical protein